jgi:hypothetical protein
MTWMIILGIVVGLLFVINGFLMAFRPDWFLVFYDWCTPGDYVAKSAAWRQKIHNPEFRFVGVLIACFGVFVVVGLLRRAL